MSLNSHFHFQPIGQGLFYEGQIGKVNVIYDCGSTETTRINNMVNRYAKELTRKTIDLLVLSHLHADHVNGLDELFKHVDVKYVFLPYLTPFQRLLLTAHEPRQVGETYYNFLADPVNYLLEKGAKKIVLIFDGKEKVDEGDNFPSNDFQYDDEDDLNEEDLNDDAIHLPDSETLIGLISKNEPALIRHSQHNRLLCKDHYGYVSLRQRWILRFFSSSTKRHLDKFIDSVKNEFGLKSLPDNEKLREIVLNPTKRKRLRDCYKTTYKDRLNDTSLILFHGPVNSIPLSITRQDSHSLGPYHGKAKIQWDQNRPNLEWGCLLTGDVDLKEIWSSFANHYKNYFSHMSDLLIPHHGSKRNWESHILNSTTGSKSWIVSAGIGNKYNHPSIYVILEILNKGNAIFWSNQLSTVDQLVYS